MFAPDFEGPFYFYVSIRISPLRHMASESLHLATAISPNLRLWTGLAVLTLSPDYLLEDVETWRGQLGTEIPVFKTTEGNADAELETTPELGGAGKAQSSERKSCEMNLTAHGALLRSPNTWSSFHPNGWFRRSNVHFSPTTLGHSFTKNKVHLAGHTCSTQPHKSFESQKSVPECGASSQTFFILIRHARIFALWPCCGLNICSTKIRLNSDVVVFGGATLGGN